MVFFALKCICLVVWNLHTFKIKMTFVIGTSTLTPRIDPVNALLNKPAMEYMVASKEFKIKKVESKSQMIDIISGHIKLFDWKRFRDPMELEDLLLYIIDEICLEEIEKAIEIHSLRGFRKCVTYLLSCVS